MTIVDFAVDVADLATQRLHRLGLDSLTVVPNHVCEEQIRYRVLPFGTYISREHRGTESTEAKQLAIAVVELLNRELGPADVGRTKDELIATVQERLDKGEREHANGEVTDRR